MKKDKLHTDKFFINQEIVVKIAKKFNGKEKWTHYTKEETYIVDSIGNNVNCHLKGNKRQKLIINDKDIHSGFLRLVRVQEKPN